MGQWMVPTCPSAVHFTLQWPDWGVGPFAPLRKTSIGAARPCSPNALSTSVRPQSARDAPKCRWVGRGVWNDPCRPMFPGVEAQARPPAAGPHELGV